MRRAVRLGALAVIVSVVLAAALGPPASALRRRRRHPKPPPPPTQTNPIEIASTAPLSADHRTATVALTVRCPTGATPVPIGVTVRQSGASGSGRSGTNYTCNGQPQRVVAPVTTGGTFQKGSASASASVYWHGSTATKTDHSTVNSNVNTTSTINLV